MARLARAKMAQLRESIGFDVTAGERPSSERSGGSDVSTGAHATRYILQTARLALRTKQYGRHQLLVAEAQAVAQEQRRKRRRGHNKGNRSRRPEPRRRLLPLIQSQLADVATTEGDKVPTTTPPVESGDTLPAIRTATPGVAPAVFGRLVDWNKSTRVAPAAPSVSELAEQLSLESFCIRTTSERPPAETFVASEGDDATVHGVAEREARQSDGEDRASLLAPLTMPPVPDAATPREQFSKTRAAQKQEYFRMYHGLHTGSVQRSRLSAREAQLMECDRLGIVPEPLCAVRSSVTELNIGDYGVGDTYACAVGAAVHLMKLESVVLRGNRLSKLGTRSVLGSLRSEHVGHLDLSQNDVGSLGAHALAEVLTHAGRLRVLRLNATKIGDGGAALLAPAVRSCRGLVLLSMRDNGLEAGGVRAIAAAVGGRSDNDAQGGYVGPHPSLTGLDLAWNRVRGGAAAELFTCLTRSSTLTALDVSWNALGSMSGGSCDVPGALARYIGVSTVLKHLDVSHNGLSARQLVTVAEALTCNHTLVGLHVAGNEGYVDARGFLRNTAVDDAGQCATAALSGTDVAALERRAARVRTHKVAPSLSWNGILGSSSTPALEVLPVVHSGDCSALRVVRRSDVPGASDAEASDVGLCWICCGFRPFTFAWRPPVSGPIAKKEVLLYASFDNWEPDPLVRGENGLWMLSRMIPRTKVRFMFRVDGVFRVAEDELFERRSEDGTDSIQYGCDGYAAPNGVYINTIGSVEEEDAMRAVATELDRARTAIARRKASRVLKSAFHIVRATSGRQGERKGDQESLASGGLHLDAVVEVHEKGESDTDDDGSHDEMAHEGFQPPVTLAGTPQVKDVAATVLTVGQRTAEVHGRRLSKRLRSLAITGASSVGQTAMRFHASMKPGTFVVRAPLHSVPVLPRAVRHVAGAPPPKWRFETSVFYPYRNDTPHLRAAVFDRDWSYTKVAAFVKDPDERESVRRNCAAKYGVIKCIFKHFASLGATSDVFSMQWNTFTEFCTTCSIPDADMCQLKDIDTIFIATNVTKERLARNPERSLTRFEFLEALCRLAIQKYVRSGAVSSPSAAVELLLEANVLPYAARDTSAQFREDVLWREEVDVMFRRHLTTLQAVYRMYSGRFKKPGETPWMSVEEWLDLMNDAMLLDEVFTEREAKHSYAFSIMTVEDEMSTDRHTRMDMVEFIHALGLSAKYTCEDRPLVVPLDVVLNAVGGVLSLQ